MAHARFFEDEIRAQILHQSPKHHKPHNPALYLLPLPVQGHIFDCLLKYQTRSLSRREAQAEPLLGEMAHARFFEDEIRAQMPKCSYRKYTISEIINAVVDSEPAYFDMSFFAPTVAGK